MRSPLRSAALRGRRFLRAVQRRRSTLRRDEIAAALSRWEPARIVLVHSSLSACGHVPGGAATIVGALRDWAGDRLLVMPTHTYCYPRGDRPAPVYDAGSSRSVVGAITEHFRTREGVIRSLHPSHSLACSGTGAEELVRGHEHCDTPCGPGTPYQKLVDRDASVLMYGCSMQAYTLFHTAEHAGEAPYLYWPEKVDMRWLDAEGRVQTTRMHRQDMRVPRRFAEVAGWAEEHHLLLRAPLGRGELLFIPSAARLHERLVLALRTDPWFLVSEEGRPEAPPRMMAS